MHRIKIDGVVYGNVGNITPTPEIGYYYNVTSLSGKKHQKKRWSKTNYTVQFFNLLDDVYTSLRDLVNSTDGTLICGFPDDEDGFIEKEYYLSIQPGEIYKGYLQDRYYKNGMTILFEAVEKDE